MKRLIIIFSVIFSLWSVEYGHSQTKDFKFLMSSWSQRDPLLKERGKWEVTQFSGDVLRKLMPKASSNNDSVINRITNIFQVTMDNSNVSQYNAAKRLRNISDYTCILHIKINNTEYEIHKAKLKQQVNEYLICINNGKDYCVCDITGYLNDEQILSFVGLKNTNGRISTQKSDTVEILTP